MAVESEIKFTIPNSETLEEIASLEEIAGYRLVDRGIISHTDVYFDTPDNRLFCEKIVFRLRTSEKGSVIGCKTQGEQLQSGVLKRLEVETKTDLTADDIVKGELPDIPPVKALFERTGKVELVKSLEAVNNRRIILLETGGEKQYELVLDDVTYYGSEGKTAVLELEVESLRGTDDGLEKIGSWLSERFNLEGAGPSKYIRGMKLVGGV